MLTGVFSGEVPINSVKASLLDITSGIWNGRSTKANGTYFNTTFDFNAAPLRCYAASQDRVTTLVVTSDIPGATFNLTSTANGPNFFDIGSGTYYRGGYQTNEWAVPDGYVTGSITIDGKEVKMVSSSSTSWFDRQWGFGLGPSGWSLFILYLNNGIKSTIWNSEPVDGSDALRVATLLYPDGHHEVVGIDPDFRPTNSFHGQYTNVTYYGAFTVNIPEKSASLVFTLPVLAGEVSNPDNPTASETLFEGYCDVVGVWNGEEVNGFACSEQHPADSVYQQSSNMQESFPIKRDPSLSLSLSLFLKCHIRAFYCRELEQVSFIYSVYDCLSWLFYFSPPCSPVLDESVPVVGFGSAASYVIGALRDPWCSRCSI